MTFDDAPERVFRNPTRQILAMGLVLVLVLIAGLVLAPQISVVFQANVYLNAMIGGVFVLGVLATFWQVAQVRSANAWLRNLHSGFKGHEFTDPPRLVASMAPMLREGRLKKRLATSTTRTILDSVALRLDEAREITRYIANLLIFLGLLGTFWGLSNTVPAVVDTIRSLAPQDGASSEVSVFDNLMRGLEDQLGGMGTAFASSLLGLAGSLVVSLLELFAGHGQNRFYRALEEWLSTHTRIGMISEGEGTEGALVALLERVDEGLERTTSFAEEAEQARMSAETRLAAAADVIARMASGLETDRAGMTDILGELRGLRADADAQNGSMSGQTEYLVTELRALRAEAGDRDRASLDALRAIAGGQAQMAESQTLMAEVQTGMATVQQQIADTQTATNAMLERSAARSSPMMTAETRTQIREIERHMRDLTVEIATARKASTEALRADLHQLIALIDERTGGPEG